MDMNGIYPLVMTNIAIEAMAQSKVREFSPKKDGDVPYVKLPEGIS